MWFIRLGKLKEPPTKQTQDWVNQRRAEAEKWGVKFHEVFFTLGQYDVVSIFEAPDEKVAMRYSMSLAPQVTGPTLVGVSREEAFGWFK
jgi:uncharacterized protein with GYD domain